MKTCKDCKYFTGMGDWNLCCTKPPTRAKENWCGFLCYEYTEACENFKEKKATKVKLSEVCNGTDYEPWELNEITWKEVGIEYSDYSIMTATTYISLDGTIAKKVFSDGMTEYYYT